MTTPTHIQPSHRIRSTKFFSFTAIRLPVIFKGRSGTAEYTTYLPSMGELNMESVPNTSIPLPPPEDGYEPDDADIPIIMAQRFTRISATSPGYAKFLKVDPGSHIIVTMPVAQFLVANPEAENIVGPIYVYTYGGGPANSVRDKDGKPIGTNSLEYQGIIGRT